MELPIQIPKGVSSDSAGGHDGCQVFPIAGLAEIPQVGPRTGRLYNHNSGKYSAGRLTGGGGFTEMLEGEGL